MFLKEETYLACATTVDKKTLKRFLPANSFSMEKIMYTKAYENILLRYVDAKEDNEIMLEAIQEFVACA